MKISTLNDSTAIEQNVTISCTVPRVVKEEIRRYAKMNNRSVSNLTGILVKMGFEEYKKSVPEDLLL